MVTKETYRVSIKSFPGHVGTLRCTSVRRVSALKKNLGVYKFKNYRKVDVVLAR